MAFPDHFFLKRLGDLKRVFLRRFQGPWKPKRRPNSLGVQRRGLRLQTDGTNGDQQPFRHILLVGCFRYLATLPRHAAQAQIDRR